MQFEDFKTILEKSISHEKKLSVMRKVNLDMMGFFEEMNLVNDLLWMEIFTDEGADTFFKKLYDENYIDGEKDLRGLYSYLIEQRAFKSQE